MGLKWGGGAGPAWQTHSLAPTMDDLRVHSSVTWLLNEGFSVKLDTSAFDAGFWHTDTFYVTITGTTDQGTVVNIKGKSDNAQGQR